MTYAPEPFVVSENGPVEEAPESARPIALYGGGGGGGDITEMKLGDFDPATFSGSGSIVYVGEESGTYNMNSVAISNQNISAVQVMSNSIALQTMEKNGFTGYSLSTTESGISARIVGAGGMGIDAFIADQPAHLVTLEAVNQRLAPLIARIEALENPEA